MGVGGLGSQPKITSPRSLVRSLNPILITPMTQGPAPSSPQCLSWLVSRDKEHTAHAIGLIYSFDNIISPLPPHTEFASAYAICYCVLAELDPISSHVRLDA